MRFRRRPLWRRSRFFCSLLRACGRCFPRCQALAAALCMAFMVQTATAAIIVENQVPIRAQIAESVGVGAICAEGDEVLVLNVRLTAGTRIGSVVADDDLGQRVFIAGPLGSDDENVDFPDFTGGKLLLCLAPNRVFDYESLLEAERVSDPTATTVELNYAVELRPSSPDEAVAEVDIALTVTNVDEGPPEVFANQVRRVSAEVFVGAPETDAEDPEDIRPEALLGVPISTIAVMNADVSVFGAADQVTDFEVGSLFSLTTVDADVSGIDCDGTDGADIAPFAIDDQGQMRVIVFDDDPTPLNNNDAVEAFVVCVRARDAAPADPAEPWGSFALVRIELFRPPLAPLVLPATRVTQENPTAFDADGVHVIGEPLDVENVTSEAAVVYQITSVVLAGGEAIDTQDQMPFVVTAAGAIGFREVSGFENLNYEEFEKYTLQVQAGRQSGFRDIIWGSSATVIIELQNVDESPVIGDSTLPTISQIEGESGTPGQPGGTPFGAPLRVNDAGDSAFATGDMALIYEIDPQVPGHTPNAETTFDIGETDGRLRIQEGHVTAVGTYNIGVRITDWDVDSQVDVDDSDSALITVTVTEDSPPIFSATEALVPLPDPVPGDEGSLGPRIVAAENDGEELVYAIVAVSSPRAMTPARLPFEIDATSGQISVETTDRELDEDAVYTFTVRATDNTGTQAKSDDIEVTIARTIRQGPPTILDVRPLLVNEGASGSVGTPLAFADAYGDEVMAWIITGIKAGDVIGDVTGREVTPRPFTIDRTGQLRVASGVSLDYEALPPGEEYYTVSVIVTTAAGGQDDASKMTSLPEHFRVYVGDVDEPPFFPLDRCLAVSSGPEGLAVCNLAVSGTQFGDRVGDVNAEDPEDDPISYEIQRVFEPADGTTADELPFRIASDGRIIVMPGTGRLAVDAVTIYVFTVRASSIGADGESAAEVRVRVNTDPQRPRFLGPYVLDFIAGEEQAGTPFAAALDRGDSADLRWSVEPADEDFVLEPNTGQLQLAEGREPFDLGILDFDIDTPGLQASKTIGVRVCNTGTQPQSCAFASVTVEVIPRAGPNILAFAADSYQRTVPEDAVDGFALGAPIGVSGAVGSIVYSLTPETAPFDINAANGQVWVDLESNERLDYEEVDSYELQIEALEEPADDTQLARTATTALTVTLIDLDDEKPVILPGQQFSVTAGRANGAEVGQVRVRDPDALDSSAVLTFEIVPGLSASPPFDVETDSGLILVVLEEGAVLTAQLAPYELSMVVTDGGGNVSAPEVVTVRVIGGSNAAERRLELAMLRRATGTSTAGLLLETLRPQLSPRGSELDRDPGGFGELIATLARNWKNDQGGGNRAGALFAGLNWSHRLASDTPATAADTFDPALPGENEDEYGEKGKPPPVYTFWLRSGQRVLNDGEISLGHGSMPFEGTSWALSAGLERRIGYRFQLGLSISHVASSFVYEIRPDVGAITEGDNEETTRVLSIYGVLRPAPQMRIWALLGGGMGDVEDRRDSAGGGERGNADTTQTLGAFGADYSLAFGNEDYPAEVTLKASGYGMRVEATDMRYQDVATGIDTIVVPGGADDIYEVRFGLRIGMPFAIMRDGVVKPYIGVDALRNSGDYYLDDDSALDFTAGLEWRAGKLSLVAEANLEELRDGQSLWGVRGDFRYSPRADGSGPAVALSAASGAHSDMLQLAADRLGTVPGKRRPLAPEPGALTLGLEAAWGFRNLRTGVAWTPYLHASPAGDGRGMRFSVGARLRSLSQYRWQGEFMLHSEAVVDPREDHSLAARGNFSLRF